MKGMITQAPYVILHHYSLMERDEELHGRVALCAHGSHDLIVLWGLL